MDAANSKRRLWQIAIIVFIAFELYFAALGLEIYFGLWAPLILMGSLILRLGVTFPVGCFLCAFFVWQWPWALAAIFAAPAVILMFPKLLAGLCGFRANPLCGGAPLPPSRRSL